MKLKAIHLEFGDTGMDFVEVPIKDGKVSEEVLALIKRKPKVWRKK